MSTTVYLDIILENKKQTNRNNYEKNIFILNAQN